MRHLSFGICLALILGLKGGAVAQSLALKPETRSATLTAEVQKRFRECYRVLGTDSVAFFYSSTYELTPPGCAAIRRHTYIDSTGVFWGPVYDFWLKNGQPALIGTYRNHLKEGQFQVFHPNGTLAARGNYHLGRPVGDWAYWYPSGQPRQVLRFEGAAPATVQQFWSETGQQLVVDGTGDWYRDEAGTRLRGRVVNGIPDGRWERRQLDTQALYAVESFAKGHFRSGRLAYMPEDGSPAFYTDASRMPVADWNEFDQAERFELGQPCPK